MDEKIKYGIISLCVILFQSVLKLYGVLITGSLSFLSETIDTFVDIVFISMALYVIRESEKPPDIEHMYGHSKIDPIGAMVQGIILIILYVLLIINAILIIIAQEFIVSNPDIGLIILLVSFSVNLVFSRILIRKGKSEKSPSLEIQGYNLFQDSIRAIIILLSFSFALFGIIFLDPFFSILISVWIIIGAFFLAKRGIKDLTDTNPVNPIILEELRASIFNIDHVNGLEELRIRASGFKLFLEVQLSVEDHISVMHANEITKSIRSLGKKYFPLYEVECLIGMDPLGGEKSVGENLINLIYSMKAEFSEILDIKDLNIFLFEEKYFISLIIILIESLSLNEAHDVCTQFETELKEEAPYLYRIITHIETQRERKVLSKEKIECLNIDSDSMQEIKRFVEEVLKSNPNVKGYHGLEFWSAMNFCLLELHVFFEGTLNISLIHRYIDELESKIRDKLKIDNLNEVLIHSEPLKGRSDGIIFNNEE